MDRSSRAPKVNWFIIAGALAIFIGLLGLPALASVASQAGTWAAALTVLAAGGLMALVITEGWKHSPH